MPLRVQLLAERKVETQRIRLLLLRLVSCGGRWATPFGRKGPLRLANHSMGGDGRRILENLLKLR